MLRQPSLSSVLCCTRRVVISFREENSTAMPTMREYTSTPAEQIVQMLHATTSAEQPFSVRPAAAQICRAQPRTSPNCLKHHVLYTADGPITLEPVSVAKQPIPDSRASSRVTRCNIHDSIPVFNLITIILKTVMICCDQARYYFAKTSL